MEKKTKKQRIKELEKLVKQQQLEIDMLKARPIQIPIQPIPNYPDRYVPPATPKYPWEQAWTHTTPR